MWKRSIVQESGGSTLELALAVALVVLAVSWGCESADLVIELPAGEAAGQYRLDYRPPQGSPAPNFTVPARASTINFQGLPGTKYHFMLYYSNATFGDLLTWNQTIVTAPEPPANLSVTLGRNKQATITWSPPALGDYTGFRFKVIPLSEREGEARNVTAEAGEWSHTLRELSPGATYQLHAFTLLHDKESAAYASRNFTTKPNTPGKFIVWFRNETTLLVLWQPPYPPGQYTHYKVSIVPPDARDSELYVEKEGEPPGPAQAAFKGLVPGRAYNISVQTVAEPEISAPTTAQYRTVPLRPTEVTATRRNTTSFSVTWREPLEHSEFEKYQVSVSGGARRPAPLVLARDDALYAAFDGLEPGAHYSVVVKTMSGKVTSWPATTDVTLAPLPPKDLATRLIENDTEPDVVEVTWAPAEGSTQDSYQVVYHEASSREDSNEVSAPGPRALLTALLPGRNYTVRVVALSRDSSSAASVTYAATRPLAPVLREISAQTRALAVAWSSDVNSRQDRYRVTWRRADVPDQPHQTLSTTETRCLVSGLFPGAVYELKVAAVSNGLTSLQHTHLKPIRPLPPVSMTVERASSNSALVRWTLPAAAASAVGEVVLRYRTAGSWSRLPPLAPDHTEAEIVDMTHGERYTIQLDTASLPADGERQESGEPLTATRTVRPNPVSDVAPLVEERNMTLEWPPPKGRVERYSVWWEGVDPPGEPGDGGDGDGGDGGGAPGGQEAGNVTVSQPGAGPARAALSGLWPGAGYRVSIAAHSYNLTSDVFTMDARTRPLIQSEMTIVIESNGSEENDTLPAFIVQYTRTPPAVSTFDTYRFRLEWGGEALVESRAAAAAPQRLAFPGLTPGQLYNITMWTVSRAVPSHPVQRQARLFPRAAARLRASRVAPRDVTLAWDAPPGVWTDFEVQWLADDDELQTRSTHLLQITISGLRPFRNYTFSVGTRAGTPATLLTRATPTSITRATLEAPPAQPSDFQPVDSRPSEVEFSWTLSPRDHNGRLQRFVIQYDEHAQLTFPPDARRGTVSGLTPGAEYTFRLWGETGAGAGAAALWTQRMAIAAPPRPAPSATPALARATTATVAVTFRSDYFSAANGNVTAYTLVVSETPRNDTPLRLPAWRDVRALPLWPPYQVTEPYYPFGTSSVEEFTIGSERCEAGARAYCNGPLKPATKYYVKLRAFTAPDKFTDTAYTVIYTEVDNTAWAAGGGALAALVALGAALGALLRRRRARPPRAAPPARPARPVRVADFLDHYRIMSADSDFRFSEEFEELKHVGREQPCSAADLPVNRPKNRFTNILPYDHSRFKLQPVDDEEGSDYINANYVPGDTSPREFIVTQGPLHSTRDDFWRMVWESNSRAIVMLTRCIEKGREKCDRYWPADARPAYYGDIAVTALTETRLPEWTATELCLQRGPDQRRLPHLHFTTWPDFGVPNPPLALARFVRAFRERVPVEAAPRPVVVHCSAGVGRSGTFVCLDRALHQLARNADTLDIFGMVASLRRERVWMVQTEQQYICIHQCVAAVLEGSDLSPPPNNNHHHNQAYEDDEGIAESGM